LDNFIHQNEDKNTSNDFYDLIDRFISGEIKFKGRNKSKGTLKQYVAAKHHLQAYELKHKIKITFDNINLDFFYKYVSNLKTLKNQKGANLSQNTIAKDIRILKTFLNEAVDLGLTNNLQFKHRKFYVSEEETDAVSLSENELIDLYRFNFTKNKKLEQVRDLFVFGSFVGLRFSDYSTIKPENIVKIDNDNFIKIKTQKTGEHVIIPCNHIVLDIFKKYKSNANRLPKSLSNQKFNDYIKEVAMMAGLTEKGRLATSPDKVLYECISSHTARRSFATNLYLDGYPTIEIQKITGHKTETSFMKYIRVTKLDAAKRLSAHMKKRWSEKMLKIA
jgi:integrase